MSTFKFRCGSGDVTHTSWIWQHARPPAIWNKRVLRKQPGPYGLWRRLESSGQSLTGTVRWRPARRHTIGRRTAEHASASTTILADWVGLEKIEGWFLEGIEMGIPSSPNLSVLTHKQTNWEGGEKGISPAGLYAGVRFCGSGDVTCYQNNLNGGCCTLYTTHLIKE